MKQVALVWQDWRKLLAKPNNLLLQISSFENPYVHMAHAGFSIMWDRTTVHVKNFSTASEARLFCKANNITHLATTSFPQFKLFDPTLEGSAKDNEGAVITDSWNGFTLRICLIPSLKQARTTNHGIFRIKHWMHKLKGNKKLFPVSMPALDWNLVSANNFEQFLEAAEASQITSIDIETSREQLAIRSCSYTFLLPNYKAKSWVIDLEHTKDTQELMFMLTCIRRANNTVAPKVFQNGRYDNSYFLRFNAPVRNYLYDTYHLMHCLYPELAKDLSFIASFTIEHFRYWKDEASSNNLEYNAKDTHNTLFAWLALVQLCSYPENKYALTNYVDHEFPLVFPCIYVAQEGLLVDDEERMRLRTIEYNKQQQALASLNTLLGETSFNPGSPKQVVNMQLAVGYTKAEGSDKTAMVTFAEAHPLYNRLAQNIKTYRTSSKAISNYYDAELLHGIMFYEIDPAGTETGRLASKKSNFWCGAQIQNQPAYCKSMYIPPKGWFFGCADGAQAESRCTAYISEDYNLINSVENSPDFHCANASLFFGIPFNDLFQTDPPKVLRKDIRTVAKRVNHGANYNMGWYVLSQTMGAREVWNAKNLLGLPSFFGVKQICEELLMSFNRAYPNIKGKYYPEVKAEIARTGKLTGATGWTRRTFLKPSGSKLDLNAAVAHPPQSLSVTIVNKAFFKAWHWQIFGAGRGKIRLKAQIHDEIFFAHHPEHGEEVANKIGEFMAEPVQVKGRTMLIPNEPKWGAARWSDLKE